MLWLLSKPLSNFLGITERFDSLVAIFAVIMLTLFRVIEWKEIERFTDWGVLLLFGGGITLSAVLIETGASKFLANILYDNLSQYGFIVLILGAAILMIFLTEIASNTASAAILVPIFLASWNRDPFGKPECLAPDSRNCRIMCIYASGSYPS